MKHRFIFVAISNVITYITGAYMLASVGQQQQAGGDTWVTLVTELGVPVTLLIFVGYGIWRWMLPYIERQTEYAQSQVEKAQAQIAEQNALGREERAEYLKHLGQIGNKLERVDDNGNETKVAIMGINTAIQEMKLREDARLREELKRLRGDE